MCGLVGAIANRDVIPLLVDGLRNLEYRGYDSAGIATLNGAGLSKQRAVGKVDELAKQLAATGMSGTMGIGHTRWATHGSPLEHNAHPHVSTEMVAVVHNGIIENYQPLREELSKLGYRFDSQTDTEVIAHRIHYHLQREGSLRAAVQATLPELEGAFAIAAISSDEPGRMIAARLGSPLVVGIGDKENFVASDVTALLSETRRFIYLEEGDVADITGDEVKVYNRYNRLAERPIQTSTLEKNAVSKGEYPHYMLKEIFEQSTAIRQTLSPALSNDRLDESCLGDSASTLLDGVKAVQICACGTSYHAGMVGRYLIESLAKIPCGVEHASEFRYRSPVVPANTLFVVLSQSGETADTLAALRYAREAGYHATLAICNVGSSSLVRESDLSFLTQAGPEIGVASTKAFTTQLLALNIVSLFLARRNGLDPQVEADITNTSLKQACFAVDAALALDDKISEVAEQLVDREHSLFLGRGVMYPIALEGALKLKEISYIHAEAYPGGELKHGPLALVDENMPIIAAAPGGKLFAKMQGNLQEVAARGGQLFILTDKPEEFSTSHDCQVLTMPTVDEVLAPLVYTIPLQLLAYHVSVMRGNNVDQPRNLAKSVTVE
ncbi:glutamine--fructose-6-phosphate transaminase (isomerizing) [Spongiibacter sp. KMU-166]|uniref:Glutamine--fructose-6-phosphate aminotransferase [isomerizing] n=1 Tax=Spongiibacter thalassae TaxID=2721624 RepID=A0ABX1GER8_9GAMM|nr:glutamine--fructose-6-phosphate transaminase (isomerizing) [Spongiibacter thalassae]NKI17048.1 glutamine--fructose-6-phosphate transaminase (isomerizing) [Spongiibacter thalassae]